MIGYALAKTGNKYLVMPKKAYLEDMVVAEKGFLGAIECGRNLDSLLPPCYANEVEAGLDFEVYDYKVEYKETENGYCIESLNMSGALEKKKYKLGNIFKEEYNGAIRKDCLFLYKGPNGPKENFYNGYTKESVKIETWKRDDLFLYCVYKNAKSKGDYIGKAVLVGKVEKIPQLKWEGNIQNLPETVPEIYDGETTVTDAANGETYRFGVLSGYSKKEKMCYINNAFAVPINKLDVALRKSWITFMNAQEDMSEKRCILVAYTVDEETKKVRFVVDSRNLRENIVWENARIAKDAGSIYADVKKGTNILKICLNNEETAEYYYGRMEGNQLVNRRIRDMRWMLDHPGKRSAEENFWPLYQGKIWCRIVRVPVWKENGTGNLENKVLEVQLEIEKTKQILYSGNDTCYNYTSWVNKKNYKIPLAKVEEIQLEEERWLLEKAKAITDQNSGEKQEQISAVLHFAKKDNVLRPALAFLINDAAGRLSDSEYYICYNKIQKKNSIKIQLCEEYNRFIEKEFLSESEFEQFYFLCVTLAEYFSSIRGNMSYTKSLTGLFLKCLEMEGYAVDLSECKYINNDILKKENGIEDEDEEETQGEREEQEVSHPDYLAWVKRIFEEYKKTENPTEALKRHMVQLILRLPYFFAYDIMHVLGNISEEEFEKRLGVSRKELIELRALSTEYAKIVKNTKNLTGVLDALNQDKFIRLKTYLYGKETEEQWERFYAFSTKPGEYSNQEVAKAVFECKSSPNKLIAEVFFGNKEYGRILASPMLSVVCKEETTTDAAKETRIVLYKEQANLRFLVTNEEKEDDVQARMPATVTEVKVSIHCEGVDTREAIYRIPLDEQKELKPGESALFEVPLESIRNAEFWEYGDVSLNVAVTYTGDYHYTQLKSGKQDYSALEKTVETVIFATIREWIHKKSKKPFLAEKYCEDAECFVGRTDKMNEIAEWIRSGFLHIYISGQKQCGKSSLLYHICDKEKQSLHMERLKMDVTQLGDNYNDVIVILKDTVSSMCKDSKVLIDDEDTLVKNIRYSIVKELKRFVKAHEVYQKDERLQELCADYVQVPFAGKAEIDSFAMGIGRMAIEQKDVEFAAKLQGLAELISGQNAFEIRFRTDEKEESMVGLMSEEEFKNWMNTFNDIMQAKPYEKRYKILLIIDEFTTLCKEILKKRKETGNADAYGEIITNVLIDGFHVDNIFTMAVGHETMKLMLDSIVVENNVISRQDPITLGELEPEDITELMLKAFSGDEKTKKPFDEEALIRLQQLSGCNPAIVKRIAKYIYKKYHNGKFGKYITKNDVERCADEVIEDVCKVETEENRNPLFEPFLRENREEEMLNEQIEQYLSVASERVCTRRELEMKGLNKEVFGGLHKGRIYDILVNRGVLKKDDELVLIKVELLQKYLRKIQEKKEEGQWEEK